MEKEKAERKNEAKNQATIVNPEKLNKKIKSIQESGGKNLHILTDFDRTLTCGSAMTSLLGNGKNSDHNPLSYDYTKEADKLYHQYRPIEVDQNLSLEEKKKAMHEWWRKHFALLIDAGLTKKHIEAIINSKKIKLRDGVNKFFTILKNHNVPIVIMSASGLGKELIKKCLDKNEINNGNVFIVSNLFVWDQFGKAIGVREPIIHAMNKDETLLQDLPFYYKIRDRENVILLGDNIEDNAMANGIAHENILKIGFLNKNVVENLEKYKQHFDVLIINDGSMNFVNQLLSEILEN
ncbi:MAG: hypothetical protein PHW50_03370 [Patescibacteria group bacterium]|nr:hypothetical protein [Patescibacteria group bacterium]